MPGIEDQLTFNPALTAAAVPVEWAQWVEKLALFATLETGWDSYDAVPPAPSALLAARAFLDALRKRQLVPTKLSPSVVGGVAFAFRKTERLVYIEFRNTGNAHAAFTDETTDTPHPEVCKVRQDSSGYAEIIAKTENYFHEQTAPRHEG